jgi:CHAD domain-containing protein
MDPVLSLLVAYQDCLGRFQDAQVALDRLESVARERWQASSPTVEEALSLGAALHVFREQASRSRSDFIVRWPSFDAGVRGFLRFLREMIGEASNPPVEEYSGREQA